MSSSTSPSPAPSETAATQQRPARRATAILLGLAVLPILYALVATNGRYGYFLDEFYHLACSEHLAWGYVDHPPLSIALLALIRAILGDAFWALRLPPGLATAGSVVLTGLMARRLGAGTFGQGLAALATAVTPIYLNFASYYSMNPFDLLFWTLGAYVILGILKNDAPKGWLLFGLIAGLGLLNKLSMGFFGFGLCVALVLTRNRKYIARRVDGRFRPGLHLWGGGALAALIFLPHLIWQVLNDWPTIEFMRNSIDLQGASPLEFVLVQVLGMHPFNLPIWIAGLYFYLFSQRGRPYRMMGIIYVSIFILLILQGTRAYYLHVAYPMLFAGGALLIESFVERGKRRRRILKPVIATTLVAGGTAVMLAVVLLIVLPPQQLLAYEESLGIPADQVALPPHLADRLCWEEFVAEVARVYETLPEKDRNESVIFTGNYAEAGAIDLFGKQYGLPRSRSYHNNYHLWGPGDTSWNVVIAVVGRTNGGVPKVWLEDMFGEIVEAGRTSCEYTDRFGRNDAGVYICREPKRPIAEAWAEWKVFD